MRIPIQVLVYPVRQTGDTWEYLLLRRIPGRDGFWQGVTGGLEEGETLLEAAERELYEETGLGSLTLVKVDLSYSFPVKDEWKHLYVPDVKEITEYVFVAYVGNEKPVIDPEEHDQYKWCDIQEALALLHYPENKKALKRCHEIVAAK